jgi:hypothetical protein
MMRDNTHALTFVMAALVAAIHVLLSFAAVKDVDGI